MATSRIWDHTNYRLFYWEAPTVSPKIAWNKVAALGTCTVSCARLRPQPEFRALVKFLYQMVI